MEKGVISRVRPRKFPKATRFAAVLTAGSMVLLGCAQGEETPEPTPVSTEITVTGPGDEAPKVEFQTPFPQVPADSEVLWDTEGDRVEDGQPVLLRMFSVKGATGEVARNDFESIPGVFRMDPQEIGTQMYEALKGLGYGSRVKVVSPDQESSLITIIDVFAPFATGVQNAPEPDLPTVTYGPDHSPLIEIGPDLSKPANLAVQQLRTGRGEQVGPGDLVILQFTGVMWSSGEVFDSTWGDQNLPVVVTVGTDELIQGIDETLVGVPIGSQLLVVVPPELGFGLSNNDLSEETLVYVIDVLATSQTPTAQDGAE